MRIPKPRRSASTAVRTPTTGNRPQLTITYTIPNTAAERHDLPQTLELTGNFPNPFANETTIRYEVERAQDVSLSIYDLLGRRVRVLVNGHRSAGQHDVTVSSEGLSAGVYLYCLNGTISCGRMDILP